MLAATLRLTPSEIEHVNRTIDDLLAGFAEARESRDNSSLPRTAMLFLMHPSSSPAE